jgi:hypothetical protein
MNPFEMVVLIVAMVMIASVMRARYSGRHRRDDVEGSDNAEALRLREEVKQLKERIHVLERITTDRENTLSRQIDELRDQ